MEISRGKEQGPRTPACCSAARPAFLPFRSSCINYRPAPTERIGRTFHDGCMFLQKWLEELRAALSEQDVVEFASSKLERARAGTLSADIAQAPLASGND